jgi:hypothetical protein
LDASSQGWNDDVLADFTTHFGQSQALVRGYLRSVSQGPFNVDTLVVVNGWQGQALSKPKGTFVGLKDNGIVCVTYPCNSIEETVLNMALTRNIAGVDLAASGAKDEQVAAGNKALFNGGILAVGRHGTLTGPAGRGIEFIASEFYLPVPAGKP